MHVRKIHVASTIGESGSNRDLRRPEWMHIIRSQALVNLWRKGHKGYKARLTLVRLRGTDELHGTGGDSRELFPEGRNVTGMKLLCRRPASAAPRSALRRGAGDDVSRLVFSAASNIAVVSSGEILEVPPFASLRVVDRDPVIQ